MTERACVMHLQLWLGTEIGLFFGPGRAELLELIEYHGSLKKAAEELGMSYRAAWGKIKKTEAVIGNKLVERKGSYKDGYQLTDYGKTLTEQFRRWCNEVEEDALQKARTIFGLEIEKEEEKGPQIHRLSLSDPPL
jgi:molybdate transport system regulatory protein